MTLLAKTQTCGILWVFWFFGLELILAFSRVVDLELKQFLGVHEFPNSFWLLWVLFGKGGGIFVVLTDLRRHGLILLFIHFFNWLLWVLGWGIHVISAHLRRHGLRWFLEVPLFNFFSPLLSLCQVNKLMSYVF